MTEETIIRYLNNQCTDQELVEVSRWIQLSDDHARLLFELEQLFDASQIGVHSLEKQKILKNIIQKIQADPQKTSSQEIDQLLD